MVVNVENGLLKNRHGWPNHPCQKSLKILILNLMPTKLDTEKQFLNRLNSFDINLDITFMYPKTHHFKSIDSKIIRNNYVNLDQIHNQHYDGMIITGSPLEYIPYQKVDFWNELVEITNWSKSHVNETLSECWATNAQLFINFKIRSFLLDQKIFGIFSPDKVCKYNWLSQHVNSGNFWMPQSRNTQIHLNKYNLPKKLKVIATNKKIGPMILYSKYYHHTFVTGHPEYGPDTLDIEYRRDLNLNLPIHKPANYFDKNYQIIYSWALSSQQFYQNWINLVKNKL